MQPTQWPQSPHYPEYQCMQDRPVTLLPAAPSATPSAGPSATPSTTPSTIRSATPAATRSAVFPVAVLIAVLAASLALASIAGASDAQEASGPTPADLLLLNGYVYTSDPQHSVADAVAVNDGLISAVGSSAELEALKGPDTRVIDLGGRMLLPGLHDVHMHVFGIVESDVCSLRSEPMSLEEMVPYLQECVQRYQYKPGAWIAVEMWDFSTGNQVSKRLPSLRAALDAVSTENPIILWGNDGHHGAVNSRALELAKDPQGKVIGMNAQTMANQFAGIRDLVGLDENGEPNGELNESARQLLGPPSRRDAELLGKLLPDIQRVLASNGITSIQDASLSPSFLPYLKNFEDSGAMRFRIQVATRLVPADFTDSLTGKIDIDQMMAIAESGRTEFADSVLVHPTAVKIYADGVLEGNPFADPPTLPNGAVLESYRQPRFHYDEASGTVDVVGYVDTASPVCVETRANMGRYTERAARDAFRAENGFHPSQCTISFGVLADPDSFMMEYVRRLDAAGFTIHIHAIGDRAVRAAVDALAQVVPPGSGNPKRHTLAHLQLVHPDDQKRIGAMGLYMAWTYAWMLTNPAYDMTVMPFIGDVTGPNGIYDPESYRMKNSYPVRSIMQAGGVTVAGSDAPV
ncbi:MAG: hypothetical protein EXR85_07655, partial [Xanthomonadales bacterium]|nr:hypothetical protein [Xanthomonadales bacterium]